MSNKVWYIVIICLLFTTCERDDVCSELAPVTSRLIIRFYNISDTKRPKSVQGLYVIGEGNEEPIKAYSPKTIDSIALPLKAFESHTSFKLSKSYTTNGGGNTDIINIDYKVVQQFLYRGCGFIAQFKDVNVEIPIDNNNWIKAIEVKNRTVNNELRAQVKIYH